MKKILFMIPSLGHGGAEKVLTNLVNHLDPLQFDITVLALFDGGINKQFLRQHIHYKFIFKKAFPANCKILALFSPKFLHQKFIKETYDIEISYLEGLTSRIVAGGRQMRKNKSVTHIATKYLGWIHVEQHTSKVASYAFRGHKEAEMIYNSFDKIVCVSKTVAEDFKSIYHLEHEPIVLYNTVESEVILEKSKEEVDPGLFLDSEFNIISVGTLKAVKGFDRLIRIHKRLIDENFSVHTYILGEGPDEETLKTLVMELGVSASFTFLGYDINPYKYVARCDLFVCSSRAEGFSTAATEALIVGTPVCTTMVSGMKEMLGENDEYGIITDNNEDALFESVRRMLSAKDMLSHYKEKAEQRGKSFSTVQTIRAVEDVLLNI